MEENTVRALLVILVQALLGLQSKFDVASALGLTGCCFRR